MRRSLTPLAGLLVAVYLTLAAVASACLFTHTPATSDHHHHSGQPTHSTLCLWACQANSDTSLLPVALMPQPLLLGLGLLLFPFIFTRTSRFDRLRSRAPPC